MNWYKKIASRPPANAIDLLPRNVIDVWESETGREASGRSPCPQCNTLCRVGACSDVGGVWWYCPKCGVVD